MLGELQDYIEAHPPPAVREAAARPPPPKAAGEAALPPAGEVRPGQGSDTGRSEEKASEAGHQGPPAGEKAEAEGEVRLREASRGRNPERDRRIRSRSPRGEREEPPPVRHKRRDVPPEEARRTLSAKSRSLPPSPGDHPSEEGQGSVKREEESGDRDDPAASDTPGVREIASGSPLPDEAEEARPEEEKKKRRRRRRRRESKSEGRRSSSTPRAAASRPSPPRPKTPPRPPPHWKGPVTIRPNNPLLRRPPPPPPDRDRQGTNKGVKKTERQLDFKEFLEVKKYLRDKERKGR